MKPKTKFGFLIAGAVLGYFITRRRWNVIHNGLIHPLYIVTDAQWVDDLHDWSGERWEKSERLKND